MVNKIVKFIGHLSIWIFIQIAVLFSAEVGNVIITEFFYKSNTNIYEYIEIYNTTQDTINLLNWKIEINSVEYSINHQLKINIHDYVVFYSNTGEFKDSTGQDYCSSYDFNVIFNNCDKPQDNLYWLKFAGLPDNSGHVKIIDNTNH